MIVLNVTYHCKPEMREEFLEQIMTEGIDVASRAEAGNIKYDYYLPVDGSNDLLLVEKWRDADAIEEHGRQPHFARLRELKPEFVNDTVIERFETGE
ncbi:MAG: antibiotic biosynthesis monooxygenase [Oscillospiraceae bacterium]|nr:antibiotic biosynthesis monooxygenase [Oscillospiraceae bacterium]